MCWSGGAEVSWTGAVEDRQRAQRDAALTSEVETESRFWIKQLDAAVVGQSLTATSIAQAYIAMESDADYLRLRSTPDRSVLSAKRGWGTARVEAKDLSLTAVQADWLRRHVPLKELNKTRYSFAELQGWTLDVYADPGAGGLVLLEYEGPDAVSAASRLPVWASGAEEVTHRIDNSMIAKWIWEKRNGLSKWTAYDRMKPVRRIALDGGPGCGKTTLIDEIREHERYRDRMVIVPEAARLMHAYGLVEIPVGDEIGMASFEGDLFRLHAILDRQAEASARRRGIDVILADRHLIHPLCYLDGNEELFELVAGTSVAREIAKGDLVVYLQLPPREIYERMAAEDPTRYEDYDQAVQRDRVYQKVYEAFGSRLVRVPFEANFDQKRQRVLALLEDFLASGAA